MNHPEIITLIISYTLAGAFVITVIFTLASLVGLMKFADQGQQKKLFAILIVELVVVCMGIFSGFVNLSAQDAVNSVEARAEQQDIATSKILDAINTRAVLTQTSGEYRLDDMFSSISHSLIEVKRNVHKLPAGSLQRQVLDIQNLLEKIIKSRVELSSTELAYRASYSDKLIHAEIDKDKLQILRKARSIAAQYKYPYDLPDTLEIGYFSSSQEASMPPY